MKIKKKLLLVVLDGFGLSDSYFGNAVKAAGLKTFNYLKENYSYTKLAAAGKAVGLPQNQIGNSEVGHLHIGAGRKVDQTLLLINKSIKERSLFSHPKLENIYNFLKEKKSQLHLCGLYSKGGVHSHLDHYLALIEFFASKKENIPLSLHLFADGRDTSKQVFLEDLSFLKKKIKNYSHVKIASLAGRFYAMDRDQRWDRIKIAYQAIVEKKGNSFTNPFNYVEQEYRSGRNDEFIYPAFNRNFETDIIKANDVIIFVNFRADRALQLSELFLKLAKEKEVLFFTMTRYSKTLLKEEQVFFPILSLDDTLGEFLAKKGYSQLRLSETEKKAHVTYFFDGGKNFLWPKTKWHFISSPKVKTYDLKPQMSALEITTFLLKTLEEKQFDFILVNFANPDMVGHTGNYQKTILALKTIDDCLNKIYLQSKTNKYLFVLTADHGNAEVMLEENGAQNKKHTINDVPFLVIKKNLKLKSNGTLANVAPTILTLLGEKKPKTMTADDLITEW